MRGQTLLLSLQDEYSVWLQDILHRRVHFNIDYHYCRASLVVQMVKHLPAMRETLAQSLGWEDPLEKERATHCSTLAWKIPWMEEPGRLQSMWSQRVGLN